MSLRSIDRLLLLPALLVLGSLTVTSCATAPSVSSSSSSRDDDEKDEAEEEEAEEEATGGCPATFDSDTLGLTDFRLLEVEEFAYPEIGTELLATGCLFALSAAEAGTETTEGEIQQGYLPGGAAEMTQIGASLESGGYTEVAEGMYSKEGGQTVAVQSSETLFTPETVALLDLGYGDTFVVVTGMVLAIG